MSDILGGRDLDARSGPARGDRPEARRVRRRRRSSPRSSSTRTSGMEIGVWECTPGSFPSVKDGISEVMQFVSGEATIVGDDGALHEIGPGTLLFTPDGWRGTWHVRADGAQDVRDLEELSDLRRVDRDEALRLLGHVPGSAGPRAPVSRRLPRAEGGGLRARGREGLRGRPSCPTSRRAAARSSGSAASRGCRCSSPTTARSSATRRRSSPGRRRTRRADRRAQRFSVSFSVQLDAARADQRLDGDAALAAQRAAPGLRQLHLQRRRRFGGDAEARAAVALRRRGARGRRGGPRAQQQRARARRRQQAAQAQRGDVPRARP